MRIKLNEGRVVYGQHRQHGNGRDSCRPLLSNVATYSMVCIPVYSGPAVGINLYLALIGLTRTLST